MPSLRRYLRLLGPYRALYAWGLGLLLLTNGLSLLVPRLLKAAVDTLAGTRPADEVPALAALRAPWEFGLALIAIGVVLAAVRTGSRMAILGAGRRLQQDVRQRLFERLQQAAPSFFARFPTGEVMSRCISDVQVLQAVASPGVLYTFNALFIFALAVPYLAARDPGLTLWLLLPYPFLAALTAWLAARVRTYAGQAQAAMAELTTRIQEALSGMEVVQAFALAEVQQAGFRVTNDDYLAKSMREATVRGAVGVASALTGGVSTAIILWVGGRRVAEGQLTYGDLALFLSVMTLVLRPTIYLGWVLSLAQRGLASLDRVEALLEAPVSIAAPDPPRASGAPRGEVEVRALTFRYPSPAEGEVRRPALTDVSLRVAPGGVFGLAGRVGSGKSTLLRAIPRLLELPPGAVLVDGVPVEEWDLRALRSAIGYVPQDGYVFSLSLEQNVAFGRPDASRDEVLEAVGLAELTKDLDQLQGGLEALVGERGVTLSGGQRQRLALARAALIRPRILLLDDALSMVDAETAVTILGNLRRVLAGTTLLVAAHRTATLLGTDEVLVLEQGRVLERGAPRELLERPDSWFARMHERQRLQRDLQETT